MRRWLERGAAAALVMTSVASAQNAPPPANTSAWATWAALPPSPTAADLASLGVPAGFRRDRLGSLVLRAGSGRPRRVVACSLEQPAFVVGQITDDGYLRLHDPVGPPRHPLWAQFHEGQRVRVATARGSIAAVVAVRSTHLWRRRTADTVPASIDSLWVDVGARSRAEVTALGVRLLAPVWRDWPPMQFGAEGDYVAGPNAGARMGCAAVVNAARRTPARGETVFVLGAQSAFGYAGLSAVVAAIGGADSVLIVDPAFAGGDSAATLRRAPRTVRWPRGMSAPATAGLAPRVRFAGSIGEVVATADVRALEDAVLAAAGVADAAAPPPPASVAATPSAGDGVGPDSLTSVARLLTALADAYGPSGHERPVREAVLAALPDWARHRAITDSAGNLVIEVGPERDTVAIVAHLDELGFAVTRINGDGTVSLRSLGGFFNSLWEGQPALLHLETASGPIPTLTGLFVPRGAATAKQPAELRAWFGVDSAALVARGVRVGTAVTGIKHAVRLGATRFTARSSDDRTGCAALVLALRALDPSKLTHKAIFAFTVREETGLDGAAVLAARYGPSVKRVHAVDTFVASDSPLESPRFALTPLGRGAVIRAVDNSSAAPPEEVDRAARIARAAGLSVQIGTTNGGNDGSEFTRYGAIDLPVSWPGRYSHSPVELLDLRDLRDLGRYVLALALAPQ